MCLCFFYFCNIDKFYVQLENVPSISVDEENSKAKEIQTLQKQLQTAKLERAQAFLTLERLYKKLEHCQKR